MRVLFMGNNWTAWKLVDWLRQQGEEIVGLVLHPPARRSYGEEIIKASGVPAGSIFDGAALRDPEVGKQISKLSPDIAISVFFGYILQADFIKRFPKGAVNTHPAFLPYNKGAYSNVWSILDRTPAGVTIHYIDEGVDTGDIIAQREEPVFPTDTGETLYRRLEALCVRLFQETWPLIRESRVRRSVQKADAGTLHKVRDIDGRDEIDLERSYRAKDLIDLMRARTFPPFKGAYFRSGERKIYLRLQLAEDFDSKKGDL